MYCAARNYAELLQWFITMGADVEAEDDVGNTALMLAAQAGATDCVQLLLEAKAAANRKNNYDESAISMASKEQTIRQLVCAGEDIGDVCTEMKRKLTGLRDGEPLKITRDEYLSGCSPRFGTSNPEVMEIPFWHAMVRAGISAYEAKAQFGDANKMDEPVWCFSRVGTSFTELPDGRFVQIGGEHEDHYDPDFCIYNDVIVHDRAGGFQVMGYPKRVFPSTDFHSATYIEGFIYIIGGLGYQGSRIFGTTPIYRLNCKTWSIEARPSVGETPGWIHDHKAFSTEPDILIIKGGKICMEVGGEEQIVDNKDEFMLDLSKMKWSRI